MDAITVLVVDRERAVAQAVAQRLDREISLAVVGTAHTAMGAVRATQRELPAVVVFDEGVVNGNLAGVLEEVTDGRASAPVKVVVTSEGEDPERAYESIRAGASAFVPKVDGADAMVATILGVVAGETRITPLVLTGVLERFRRRAPEAEPSARPLPHLTSREREVLECLTAGLDRTHIARRLGLSVHTVRTHTQRIFAKLEVHSSVEAVSVATRAGVVSPRTVS